MTVEYLREPGTIAAWKSVKQDLLLALPTWCQEVPYQIKSIAVRDACKAVQNAKQKCRAGLGFQQVSFRSRKDPLQSCFIPKTALTAAGIYPTVSGKLDFTEEVANEHLDCRLVLDHGRYFVCAPQRMMMERAESQGRIVSLDPGVRTFLTWFSETSCGKIGAQAITPVYRLCYRLDEILGKVAKAAGRHKRHLKQAVDRLKWRVRNLIDELHWKAARFLCLNFDVILLPTFEVQGMTNKLTRRIGSKTVRGMLTLAHYRFKQRLRQKAFELGKVVIDVNEAFTSKTASWTGEVKRNFGSAKVICSNGVTMDRDENGARGILLRALGDQPALRACLA